MQLLTEIKKDGVHVTYLNNDLVAIIKYVDGHSWDIEFQSADHQQRFNTQLVGLKACEYYVLAIAMHMNDTGY